MGKMEQSIELIRKRHAYYATLIAKHSIHTAREFYDKLHEQFAMFGVDLFLDESESECQISITCEDYDYENYTVVDGTNGGLATIKATVGWKHPIYLCSDEVHIFADTHQRDYITTGYTEIDELIGGWKKSSVSLIVGRPHMGKSTLCYNMALNTAQQGIPVALFSLSESKTQIVTRMISCLGLISVESIRSGNLCERETRILKVVKSRFKGVPLYIDDKAPVTVSELSSQIIELKKLHDINIFFIDYLHLINSDKEVDSREEEITRILSELNDISIKYSITIVMIGMLPKMSWRHDGSLDPHYPQLSFLLESERSIPSTICFLYRPDYYNRKNKGKKAEIVDFIVAKSTEGKTGTVPLKFYPDFLRFEQIKNK